LPADLQAAKGVHYYDELMVLCCPMKAFVRSGRHSLRILSGDTAIVNGKQQIRTLNWRHEADDTKSQWIDFQPAA
jgi:hypothetical protein